MGALLSICFKGKDTGLIEPKVPIRAKKRSSKSKASSAPSSGSSSKRSSLTNQHLLSGTNAAPSPNYQGVDGYRAQESPRKNSASQSPQSPRASKGPFFGSPPSSPVDKNAPQKSSKKGFSRSFSLKDKKTKNQAGSLDRRMSLRMMGGGQPLVEDDHYETSNSQYNNNF